MRKHVLFFLITFSINQIGISQTCYNVIADLTGLDNSSYISQLESASCELRNAFPTEFQSDFKVFDFGFYSLSENIQGGFQAVWDNKVIPETTVQSKYYLLFGKQLADSKGKSKLWVKTNLPKDGAFNCFTTTQFNLLENTLLSIGNKKLDNGISFYESELEVLENLKTRILSMKECCSSNFNRSVCTTCPSSQDIELFYITNGFEVDEVKILKENGLALQRVPSQSSNVLNYSNLIYNFEGNPTDPQAQVESIIESMNSDGKAKGIIIDNNSLCTDPTQPSFRSFSSSNEAVALFNSGFEIQGVDTRLVFHLFDDEDESKQDKLYRNYLYAYKGVLESSNLELSPNGVAPFKETIYENYVLTGVNNCTASDTLLEVIKEYDTNKYYSYKLENCNWVKKDLVQFNTVYPTSVDPDQYSIAKKSAKKTLKSGAIPLLNGSGSVVGKFYEYDPCHLCYEYAVGNKANTSTETLMKKFYYSYSKFDFMKTYKDQLFNSFVYGKGNNVVWTPSSEVSKELAKKEEIKTMLDNIQNEIRTHFIVHKNLGKGFNPTDSLMQKLRNVTITPNLSSLLNIWAYQMFGGLQGRSVNIVSFKKLANNSGCSIDVSGNQQQKYECEFLFTLIDNFGLGQDEKWYLPGIPEQWTLQHYRNNYCCDNKAFTPVVNHKIEFSRKFTFCTF